MKLNCKPGDGDERTLDGRPAALVADEAWQVVMDALGVTDDPAAVLDQVADEGRAPPEGLITRELLIAWTASTALGGGLLKCNDSGGFRANGRYEEPFLSVVLGRGDRKARVLEDIKSTTPQMYPVIIKKLNAVARSAKLSRSRIEFMAVPPVGKAMLNALYLYGENLAVGVADE